MPSNTAQILRKQKEEGDGLAQMRKDAGRVCVFNYRHFWYFQSVLIMDILYIHNKINVINVFVVVLHIFFHITINHNHSFFCNKMPFKMTDLFVLLVVIKYVYNRKYSEYKF